MSSELGFSKTATGILDKMPDKRTIPPCKYLRKKGTDEIFIYTIYLAERKDMEPYDGQIKDGKAFSGDIQQQSAEVNKQADKPSKKKAEKEKQPEYPEEDELTEEEQVKVSLIAQAIGSMLQDNAEATAAPPLDDIKKACGMVVTGKERTRAWNLYKSLKKG
jgi:hypothetical protein